MVPCALVTYQLKEKLSVYSIPLPDNIPYTVVEQGPKKCNKNLHSEKEDI